MATIAEQLIARASESIQQNAPNVADAMAKGAQLAQNVEQLKNQRAQLEQQKQEMQMQKANSVVDTLKIAAQSKDRNLKKFLLTKVMPAKVKALGMEEFFTPQSMEMIQTSDEALQKVLGLQLDLDEKIRSGVWTGKQALDYAKTQLTDPESLAMLDTDQLFAAQEFAKSEVGKSYRAQKQAEAALGKQIQGQQAVPQVEASKKIADTYAAFKSAGGKAALEKNLAALREVRDQLASGKIKTGGVITSAVANSPRLFAQADPALKAAADRVRGAINLRATLADPNPTAIQIQETYGRAFDPSLPSSENVAKIDAMIAEMTNDAELKQQEFIKQGLMSSGDAYSVPKGEPKKKKSAPAAGKKEESFTIRGKSVTGERIKELIKQNKEFRRFVPKEILDKLGL